MALLSIIILLFGAIFGLGLGLKTESFGWYWFVLRGGGVNADI